MKKSKLLKNVITGFGGQFIAIILGLIVPRLFITSYGSDINGLLGTITQIFTYMALMEAGIGQAARNALYRPISQKDQTEINNVLSVAQNYFRRLSVYYVAGVIALAFLLPFVVKTKVSYLTIFLIVIFEGLSGAISFYFIQTQTILLSVDGKSYVNNGIVLVNKIIGYTVKIVMAKLGINIILLQLAYFVITIAKVLVYKYYIRKNYSWIKLKKADKSSKLQDRNAYVITEIAWTIFSSTDMIVLSTLISTQLSSVYSIYNMIFVNLNVLLNAVYYSLTYLLGYAYHENIKNYEGLHDAFISTFLGIMTVLMSVCYLLTIPFVTLYTKGVTDINYIYNQLPIMFCLIQLLSWSRYVPGNLTALAGYAKRTSYISLIEAITNIILSVILAPKFGVIDVTLTTVIALPLKVIWCVYVSDKIILKRSYWKTVSIFGVNYLFFGVIVFMSKFIPLSINSYSSFFAWGVLLTLVFGIIGIGLNLLVNRSYWTVIKKSILKR